MSAAASKALVRRFYEEIDKGNLDAMDELVDPDYLDHPPPFPGLPPVRKGQPARSETVLRGIVYSVRIGPP